MIDQQLAKTLTEKETFPFLFSICTLVSKPDEYREMVESYIKAGFDRKQCEYLCIDNSAHNTFDAFSGLNQFLRKAQGKYIILCHQDIILHDAGIQELTKQIEYMDSVDPQWAILSNAGGINFKYLAMHLTQNSGNKLHEPDLPLQSITVDENFMVVKNSANLALSADLSGFHLYGTDLCVIAKVLGYNSYVIDFNLIHKSDGNADAHFFQIRKQLIKKYRKAFRARFISTTITRFYLSGNRLGSFFINTPPILFFVRQFFKFFKPKRKHQV